MRILIQPIISEKSMQAASAGKYTFKVANSVNKPQIAGAIKEFYKADAVKINIIVSQPEQKLYKQKYKIMTKKWKKAIVTVKKGQKIEGFEVK